MSWDRLNLSVSKKKTHEIQTQQPEAVTKNWRESPARRLGNPYITREFVNSRDLDVRRVMVSTRHICRSSGLMQIFESAHVAVANSSDSLVLSLSLFVASSLIFAALICLDDREWAALVSCLEQKKINICCVTLELIATVGKLLWKS